MKFKVKSIQPIREKRTPTSYIVNITKKAVCGEGIHTSQLATSIVLLIARNSRVNTEERVGPHSTLSVNRR